MTSPYLILVSLVGIAVLVSFKAYEHKTGRSFWTILRIERLRNRLESIISQIFLMLEKIEAKKISILVRETAIIVLEFYRAIQKISAEKFQKVGSVQTQNNGNKAASFYLKNIKEHKERIEDSLEGESTPE